MTDTNTGTVSANPRRAAKAGGQLAPWGAVERMVINMEVWFVPSNLTPGASVCTLEIFCEEKPTSVSWCRAEDYPEKLSPVDVGSKLRVRKNGTYSVELTSPHGKQCVEFTICHLKDDAASPLKGHGTREDPFLIENSVQLNAVRAGLSSHYRLVADIHLELEMKNVSWLPIGHVRIKEPTIRSDIPIEEQDLGYIISGGFTGELDGNGHTIFGLTCVKAYKGEGGLFGGSDEGAYIHDVSLRGCRLNCRPHGLVATIVADARKTRIERCAVDNTTVYTDVIGGGLVGMAREGTKISCCQFEGELSGEPIYCQLGGILGCATLEEEKKVCVEDCCVKATIKDCTQAAGIANGFLRISRCFFSGCVSAKEFCAGIVTRGSICAVKNCVCGPVTIHYWGEEPISCRRPTNVTMCDSEGNQTDSLYLENARVDRVGRIMCDHFFDLPDTENQNYASEGGRIISHSDELLPESGSCFDGKTVDVSLIGSASFLSSLGWDLASTWDIGADALPRLRLGRERGGV